MLLIDTKDLSVEEWLLIFEHIAEAFKNYKNATPHEQKMTPAKWFENNFKVAVTQDILYRRDDDD